VGGMTFGLPCFCAWLRCRCGAKPAAEWVIWGHPLNLLLVRRGAARLGEGPLGELIAGWRLEAGGGKKG